MSSPNVTNILHSVAYEAAERVAGGLLINALDVYRVRLDRPRIRDQLRELELADDDSRRLFDVPK